MMTGSDQLQWEYDDSWARELATPEEHVRSFREHREKQRGQNHPLWAVAAGRIVGMIGINRHTDNARAHSAEIGFGVTATFTRRGIGRQLVMAAIEKARLLGLKRLEADCFADNVASTTLLGKCGFKVEGVRIGAICKDGTLRDQRLFGLML
jgi:RimJ/RimL family protein N-acetyltransferase